MIYRRFVPAAFWIVLTVFSPGANAAALVHGGVPVDFALWQPKPPAFDYAQMALEPARRAGFQADEHGLVELLSRTLIHIASDGTVERKEVHARLYLDSAGIQDYGNLHRWVDSHAEVMTIEQAYTLLPDGRRIAVDPSTIQLTVDNRDDVFTDYFDVIVPFPGLEPGAIAVLVTTSRSNPKARILPWSLVSYPQWFTALERFELEVSWAAGSAAPRVESNHPAVRCSQPAQRRIACEANRNPPFPTDPDVYYKDIVPSILIAEPTTWQTIARTMTKVIDGAMERGPALDAVIERQLAGASDDLDKLDRLHRFVTQDIRYLGLEQGLGGVVPRPTATTLQRGFGDCKDKTALFVHLARRVGFEAYAALASTERRDLSQLILPAASYFNHMVACVRLPGGEDTCVDLTDANSSYRHSEDVLNGAIRLDLREETRAPATFDRPTYLVDRRVQSSVWLNPDGTTSNEQSLEYLGAHASFARAYLKSMTAAEKERWAKSLFDDLFIARESQRFKFVGLDDVAEPVAVRSSHSFSRSFDRGTLQTFYDDEVWLAMEAGGARSNNQMHAYRFSGLRFEGETTYHLPEGLAVAYYGPLLDFNSPYGVLRRSYQSEGVAVRVTTKLEMPAADILPEELDAFNRFLDHVQENRAIWFNVEPTGS